MTVKRSISLSDDHYRYLRAKVEAGVFATPSAAMAAGIERLMEDERAYEFAFAVQVLARAATPLEDFVDEGDMFEAVRKIDRSRH